MGNLTPPSKIAIKGKKYYMRAPLKCNITFMTINNFDIHKDIIDRPKVR